MSINNQQESRGLVAQLLSFDFGHGTTSECNRYSLYFKLNIMSDFHCFKDIIKCWNVANSSLWPKAVLRIDDQLDEQDLIICVSDIVREISCKSIFDLWKRVKRCPLPNVHVKLCLFLSRLGGLPKFGRISMTLGSMLSVGKIIWTTYFTWSTLLTLGWRSN